MLSGTISSVPSPAPAITFDPATASNVTLSGGNLIVTNTGTTSGDQGARVSSVFGKSTGKRYFEMNIPKGTNRGEQVGCGVGTTTSLYTDMGASALNGAMALNSPGGSFYELWQSGNDNGTSTSFGGDSYQCARVAVDLDARLVWIGEVTRFTQQWNGQSVAVSNPVTGIGGLAIPAGIMVPMVTFGGASGISGNTFKLNVGATWFFAGPPSGFFAWGALP